MSLYKPTDLEKWITEKYQKEKIIYACDMDIDRIASVFNSVIHIHPTETKAIWDEEFGLIFIQEGLENKEHRLRVFHEIAHIALHAGNQSKMNVQFIQYQEFQAAQFQLYAAMPFYILNQYKRIDESRTYIKMLSDEFKLPPLFVKKRVNQIQRRIYQEMIDRKFRTSFASPPPMHGYTQETQEILRKLEQLRTRKQGGGNAG